MNNNILPGNILKYCPRCGSEEFQQHTEKSLQCNTCSFQLFINAAAAVAAIIRDANGRIMLTRRKHEPHKNMFDLPGGFVDLNETAENALYREIKEELNLEVVYMEYFTSFPNIYPYAGMTYFTLDLAFICDVKSFDPITARDDINGYEFFAPKDLNVDTIGAISIQNIVKEFLKRKV